jgi:hypothetical protein
MVPDLNQDLIQFIYEIKCSGIKDDAARYIIEHCIDNTNTNTNTNTNNDDDNNNSNNNDILISIKQEKALYDSKKQAERQQEIDREVLSSSLSLSFIIIHHRYSSSLSLLSSLLP